MEELRKRIKEREGIKEGWKALSSGYGVTTCWGGGGDSSS